MFDVFEGVTFDLPILEDQDVWQVLLLDLAEIVPILFPREWRVEYLV